MDPRITSIENLIASDPAGRNIFSLVVADQLHLAAQSLRLAKRVALISGFYIPEAGAGETDGPPGAKVLGRALTKLGITVDYVTDELNAPLFEALGLPPLIAEPDYIDTASPTHLVSVERAGRGSDGRYRNMRGIDITDTTAPLDELFLEGSRQNLITIGIGDGGNEIGMGKVFADLSESDSDMPAGSNGLQTKAHCVVATDFCIAAGVSNWGAFGLAGALSILEARDLLPSPRSVANDLETVVLSAGAVDGITHRREPTVDGLDTAASVWMLESIRRQLAPSPLERSEPLDVGVLGYGESGRAATRLLTRHGHRVHISDAGAVSLDPGTTAAGVESGGHNIDFLGDCDVVMASPGISADAPIFEALHRRSVPVMSELELAFQVGLASPRRVRPAMIRDADDNAGDGDSLGCSLIGITGTVGKRTTVELIQRCFTEVGRSVVIGGNRGSPLSDILCQTNQPRTIALAVSSFQLESVVSFNPSIAILLNIKEAHLDRHRSIAEYTRIKSRIFMNHTRNDALVLPFDDPQLRKLTRKHRGRTFFISAKQSVDRGAWLDRGVVRLNVDGYRETIGPAAPDFPENLLATVLTARLCGIPTDRLVAVWDRILTTVDQT